MRSSANRDCLEREREREFSRPPLRRFSLFLSFPRALLKLPVSRDTRVKMIASETKRRDDFSERGGRVVVGLDESAKGQGTFSHHHSLVVVGFCSLFVWRKRDMFPLETLTFVFPLFFFLPKCVLRHANEERMTTVSLFFLSLFCSLSLSAEKTFFERDGDGDRVRLFLSRRSNDRMTFLSLLFGIMIIPLTKISLLLLLLRISLVHRRRGKVHARRKSRKRVRTSDERFTSSIRTDEKLRTSHAKREDTADAKIPEIEKSLEALSVRREPYSSSRGGGGKRRRLQRN